MTDIKVSSVNQSGGITLGVSGNKLQVAYYARCMTIYGTPQEARDIKRINRLGYAVLPFPDQADIERMKERRPDVDIMEHFFRPLVREAQVFFFRSLPSLEIPGGVAKELGWALEMDTPVLELASVALRRVLTIEETRSYLKESGYR